MPDSDPSGNTRNAELLPRVAAIYVRWIFVRAALHNGWWLLASLYMVTEAGLTASQLVVIGAAQASVAFVFEVPVGVIADTISRKRSIVIAHALMGTAMLSTGLVTSFLALVATQMLWGLSWTFSSGADVAWLTDELDQPERVAGVLVRGAKWEQVGAAGGMLGLGALGWGIGLGPAIVLSGGAMLVLGIVVAVQFGEHNFTPTRERRWAASMTILQTGAKLARHDRQIGLVLLVTVLTNGAGDAFARLYPKQLVELNMDKRLLGLSVSGAAVDPIVWLTGLGLLTLGVGALALKVVEARVSGGRSARVLYAAVCVVGATGMGVLAVAPNAALGMVGVLTVGGIFFSVSRIVSVIWINGRATSDVRATVHSFLAQSEYLGEILLGITISLIAREAGVDAALLSAGALVLLAGVLVSRSRTSPHSSATKEPAQ